MAERYVRPTAAGWLTPTLLAPWIATYGAVTALTLLHLDGLFGKVLGWTVGMIVGSAWAFLFCTVLVVVDLLLLTSKVRTLPVGKRAWGAALGCPFLVFAVYAVAPPYRFYASGPWAIAAAVLVPMVVVAVGSRIAFGTKPPR